MIPLPALIRGLEGITFVVDRPESLADPMAGVFGVAQTRLTRQRLDVSAGAAAVRYLAPSRFDRRYPGHPFGRDYPGPAVLTFLVSDLANARKAVALPETLAVAGERLVLLPRYRGGPLLEFAVE